jgi:hypothetical protein
MSWADILDVLNAAALTIGALFAAFQLADLRRQRRRESVLALVRSYQSADFTAALRQINSLPDGADRATIRELLGPTGENQVFLVGLTWESLGVLVFRHEVDMETMDDFFSGAIIISWRKLSTFVEEDRASLERETVWEWFQWLADRTCERESAVVPIPAHIAHRDWRPDGRRVLGRTP